MTPQRDVIVDLVGQSSLELASRIIATAVELSKLTRATDKTNPNMLRQPPMTVFGPLLHDLNYICQVWESRAVPAPELEPLKGSGGPDEVIEDKIRIDFPGKTPVFLLQRRRK